MIQSDRGARFYRCVRADTDQRYARYPVLPVTICQGHELAREVPTPEPTS